MLSRCMLIAAAFAAGPAMAQVVLINENFDGLALGPNTEETRTGRTPTFPLGTPGLWTPTPPQDWSVDNTYNGGVPGFGGTFDPETGAQIRANDGVDEWEGWTFAREDFFKAEGQGRQHFTKGQNVVAVADPDEFDDAAPGIPAAGGATFNTLLTTPTVDFSAARTTVPGAKLAIQFDSSYRGEDKSDEGDDHQVSIVTANFGFGSVPVEVLRWAPNEINPFTGLADPGFTGYATAPDGTQFVPSQEGSPEANPFINQTVFALIDIPAGLEGGLEVVSLSFAMETARNDWWWAIDNLQVSIVPEPTSAVIALLGLAGFAARRR